ncbi:unnamed protein product [Amoebophrya sp. A25]|nr:unnamed protein product [Amoebophrya sp. A25]|eukprot:GSA25T00001700001.1
MALSVVGLEGVPCHQWHRLRLEITSNQCSKTSRETYDFQSEIIFSLREEDNYTTNPEVHFRLILASSPPAAVGVGGDNATSGASVSSWIATGTWENTDHGGEKGGNTMDKGDYILETITVPLKRENVEPIKLCVEQEDLRLVLLRVRPKKDDASQHLTPVQLQKQNHTRAALQEQTALEYVRRFLVPYCRQQKSEQLRRDIDRRTSCARTSGELRKNGCAAEKIFVEDSALDSRLAEKVKPYQRMLGLLQSKHQILNGKLQRFHAGCSFSEKAPALLDRAQELRQRNRGDMQRSILFGASSSGSTKAGASGDEIGTLSNISSRTTSPIKANKDDHVQPTSRLIENLVTLHGDCGARGLAIACGEEEIQSRRKRVDMLKGFSKYASAWKEWVQKVASGPSTTSTAHKAEELKRAKQRKNIAEASTRLSAQLLQLRTPRSEKEETALRDRHEMLRVSLRHAERKLAKVQAEATETAVETTQLRNLYAEVHEGYLAEQKQRMELEETWKREVTGPFQSQMLGDTKENEAPVSENSVALEHREQLEERSELNRALADAMARNAVLSRELRDKLATEAIAKAMSATADRHRERANAVKDLLHRLESDNARLKAKLEENLTTFGDCFSSSSSRPRGPGGEAGTTSKSKNDCHSGNPSPQTNAGGGGGDTDVMQQCSKNSQLEQENTFLTKQVDAMTAKVEVVLKEASKRGPRVSGQTRLETARLRESLSVVRKEIREASEKYETALFDVEGRVIDGQRLVAERGIECERLKERIRDLSSDIQVQSVVASDAVDVLLADTVKKLQSGAVGEIKNSISSVGTRPSPSSSSQRCPSPFLRGRGQRQSRVTARTPTCRTPTTSGTPTSASKKNQNLRSSASCSSLRVIGDQKGEPGSASRRSAKMTVTPLTIRGSSAKTSRSSTKDESGLQKRIQHQQGLDRSNSSTHAPNSSTLHKPQGPLLPFHRLSPGNYRFGTRQVQILAQNGKPIVRVAGGSYNLAQFLRKFEDGELQAILMR